MADQIEEMGLKPIPIESGVKHRSYMAHFGKELHSNGLVELKVKAGLTLQDVIINK